MVAMTSQSATRRRPMLYTLLLLGGTATTLFVGLYLIDWFIYRPVGSPFAVLFHFDLDTLQNALGNLSQVVAAVLGIVITVVSIVVQLAATRYTPRIADMFFRDRTNLAVLSFFTVACIDAVWVAISVGKAFLPRVSIIFALFLVTASLLMMVPYFAYVFDFLDPDRVVGRIQAIAVAAATDRHVSHVEERQRQSLNGIEQLSTIAINAVSQKDKAIATGAVDAIKDLLVTYLSQKKSLQANWFTVSDALKQNPDFVSLTRESLHDLSQTGTWLEWKTLRQYQTIYNEALGEMPDMNYLIAINSRYIGEAALAAGDAQALGLVIKFFNSYLRATLNGSEVRTAYNVLNQYRQLAERALELGHGALVGEVASYIRYYGRLAQRMNLGFVTETAAYDLAALCERAFAVRSSEHATLVEILLTLDKEADSVAEEKTLRGVRKAQAKLASFYLLNGAESEARKIYDDMKDEPAERLRSLCEELVAVESKDFWEVIDRGTNFDFLDGVRKKELRRFFSWFSSLPK